MHSAPRGVQMRLLSIDPGLGTLGYAVFVDGKFITCGVVKTAPKEYGMRLCEIMADVGCLIAEHQPDEIAIEMLFAHYKNKGTMEGVSAARGCVFMLAAQNHIPVTEYTPTSIKMRVSGRGRADKKEVQRAVAHILHLPIIQPDDAADAVAIGLTHLKLSSRSL